MPAPSSKKKSITISKSSILLDILERIRKVDPEFPIQYIICLIAISENQGCSITDLANRCKMAISTTSRIVGALSEYRQLGEPYHFIEARLSTAERRKKELYITDLGDSFLNEILIPLKKNI